MQVDSHKVMLTEIFKQPAYPRAKSLLSVELCHSIWCNFPTLVLPVLLSSAICLTIATKTVLISKLSNIKNHHTMLQFITNSAIPSVVIDQAVAVMEGGCKWIQLRMKNSPREAVVSTARELKPLCAKYECILIIDDLVDVSQRIATRRSSPRQKRYATGSSTAYFRHGCNNRRHSQHIRRHSETFKTRY